MFVIWGGLGVVLVTIGSTLLVTVIDPFFMLVGAFSMSADWIRLRRFSEERVLFAVSV